LPLSVTKGSVDDMRVRLRRLFHMPDDKAKVDEAAGADDGLVSGIQNQMM
jgi:hypothetical protein